MDYKEAYAKSLRLLNVRFLSEGELRRKLERHDADGEVIDAVIAKLKEEREEEIKPCIRCNTCIQRFKDGADARKIARFLQYRGFSPAVIRNVVDDFYS